MKKIMITINNKKVEVKEGSYVLDAVKQAGFNLPTLCYMKDYLPEGACRMCLVEIEGVSKLITSCSEPARDGMIINTNTKRLIDARKTNLELILSNHNNDCNNCLKNTKCALQSLSDQYNCDTEHFGGSKTKALFDTSHPSFIRDNSKCILCRKCVRICKNQACDIISVNERSFASYVGTHNDTPLIETKCTGCGQCVVNCPTGALMEQYELREVIEALNNKELTVIAATAPSARVGIGEEFGLDAGTDVEKQMVESLKLIGFNKVFDIDFGADMTIVEEAYEFTKRFEKNENIPMFTSCCPAWVSFVEHFYPEFIPNLSTTKSPQEIFAKGLKTYYAKKNNLDPKNIYLVSIMPCTAKKQEKLKHGDTNTVITVREFAELIRMYNVDFKSLKGQEFDQPLGLSSGAGAIFGTSGGVMEAALRTAHDLLAGEDIEDVEYKAIRGLKGIKEATVELAGKEVNLCVASGLGNAKKVLEDLKSGKKKYDLVEIMACPGGCINGGGMPYTYDKDLENRKKALSNRSNSLYKSDPKRKYRKSHKNPDIIKMYEDIGKPGSKKAHELFHTTFTDKSGK
jgi:NADP-reducing hydrogenase subunit HndD